MSNTKPKIDVVVKYFIPVTAGIETNMLETYSILAENGWDVTIHTSRDTYLKKNHLPEAEIIRGLKVKRHTFGRFGFWPNINWKMTEIVALHNFDIFPHFQIMFYAFWLKIIKRKKFLFYLTPHGGFNPEWSIFSIVEKLIKKTYSYTLGVFLINHVFDGVRAVSEWEAEEMRKYKIRNKLISVISNGVENDAFLDSNKLASAEIKEKVGFYGDYMIQIGRVYKIKNYETALRALALSPVYLKYVITGPVVEKEYKKKLDDMINELGLQGRVIFTGVIRGIDKYYLIKHAKMMVHMAIWESFCNVVHEGMSQGLPCIVADNTALPLLIKNNLNGYCVGTYNHKALAEKITYILNSDNSFEVKKMRECNREFGLKHSWREVGNRMGEFYLSKMKMDLFDSNVIDKKVDVLEKQIELIKKNKIPCYFISPHLDDAVFSAGTLISTLSKHTKVYIITLFTESSSLKTLSARAYLNQCKSNNAFELFKKRREEDIAVVSSLGAESMHLGFVDALWRIKSVSKLRKIFSFVFPEFQAVYPTHRLHIAKGKVSKYDDTLCDDIRTALNKIMNAENNNDFVVFGPSAIGNHTDHVITRNICEEMFPSLIHWADMPYNLKDNEIKDEKELGEKTFMKVSDDKIEMLKGYKTQFEAMFGKEELSLPPEIFYLPKLIKEKFKVSVFIPAYNEEDNIQNILKSLITQKEVNYELLEIIVSSDGSTDKTAENAQIIKNNKIKILDFKERKGVIVRQNEALKIFKGDILVIINADVLPRTDYFLSNIISPFYKFDNLGIVSNIGIPLLAVNYFEQIINLSTCIKFSILGKYRGGDNIYMCHGHSRAISRNLASKLVFPEDIAAEDAYSYLRAKELGFKFIYNPKAAIYFRSPQTYGDHIKQSARFIASIKNLPKYFSNEIIENNLKLPVGFAITFAIRLFIISPIKFLYYCLIYSSSLLNARKITKESGMWEPSLSSKKLIINK